MYRPQSCGKNALFSYPFYPCKRAMSDMSFSDIDIYVKKDSGKKKRYEKRLHVVTICIIMLLTMAPVSAFTADNDAAATVFYGKRMES